MKETWILDGIRIPIDMKGLLEYLELPVKCKCDRIMRPNTICKGCGARYGLIELPFKEE